MWASGAPALAAGAGQGIARPSALAPQHDHLAVTTPVANLPPIIFMM
jgi:hypothetical protein